ncbi:MAG TPA: hypothetical protein VGD65_06040 [Chryseosolibacter sp.]
MKKRTSFFILILSILALAAFGQKKEFGWIIGTWKLKEKDIVEIWNVSEDGKSLNGFSMKMTGAESTLLEETKLIFSGNSFYYIADVAGDQDPVDFPISSYDEVSFVAENPSHDFPKVIRYRLIKKDGKEFIEASIEGDGKVIPYHFEKIR